MGTSGSFAGGKSGLVPSWVDEPVQPAASSDGDGAAPEDGEGAQDNIGTAPQGPTAYPPIRPPAANSGLGGARGNVTRGARTSDSGGIRRGAGQYVSASGGGRNAARRMPSAKATASGIAGLARSVASQGATAALRRFNLEVLAGAPAVDVFAALTDALCPPGGTIDEAIARDAMLETVAELAAQGVGNFDELTAEDLQEFFLGVVIHSIEGKILNEVGTNAIRLPPDLAAVERAQRMLHDFVSGCVRDRFADTGRLLAVVDEREIDQFVSDLYAAAFDLMQSIGEAS